MSEYIEREKLIEDVMNDCCELVYYTKADAIDCIKSAHAADVKPVVHGKWKWITEDKYRCTNCGIITRVDECMGKPMYKGCPYCMSIMELEDCP